MKTDKQIQQDVIGELKWQPSVKEARIGVEVKDGIVTLAGHVASYAEPAQFIAGQNETWQRMPRGVRRAFAMSLTT